MFFNWRVAQKLGIWVGKKVENLTNGRRIPEGMLRDTGSGC